MNLKFRYILNNSFEQFMIFKNNFHKNDSRINFNNENHTYTVDGKKIKNSVSQIIESFFPVFDSEYWSRFKAKEKLDFLGKKYQKSDLDITQKQILEKWEFKRKESARKGTILHQLIEDFYKNKKIDEALPEFLYFKEFISKYPNLMPFKTEWKIFDSKVSIAGTVDMVYQKKNGDLFIFDWKRSTKVVNDVGTIIKSDFDFGYDELNNISNNSYNKYCLQLNLYKYILEENYDKHISSMNILVLHPKYHTFFHLKIPELKKETKFLIRKSREA